MKKIFILVLTFLRAFYLDIEPISDFDLNLSELRLVFTYYLYRQVFKKNYFEISRYYYTFHTRSTEKHVQTFYFEQIHVLTIESFQSLSKYDFYGELMIKYDDRIKNYMVTHKKDLMKLNQIYKNWHETICSQNLNIDVIFLNIFAYYVTTVVEKIIIEIESVNFIIVCLSKPFSGFYYNLDKPMEVIYILTGEQIKDSELNSKKDLQTKDAVDKNFKFITNNIIYCGVHYRVLDRIILLFLYNCGDPLAKYRNTSTSANVLFTVLEFYFKEKLYANNDKISENVTKRKFSCIKINFSDFITNKNSIYYKYVYQECLEEQSNLLNSFFGFLFRDSSKLINLLISHVIDEISSNYNVLNTEIRNLNSQFYKEKIFIYK